MARTTFDDILLGKSGPAYFSFGKEPIVGSYIEGAVVEKKHRHSTKFQTQQQRDAGLPTEYEYFVGKAKTTSTLPFEEYVKQVSNAKPVFELLLILQTALRDPAKDTDDGLRTFTFPWRAQQELASRVRVQGLTDGLPVGSFVRVTLTELVPVPGVATPRREYSVGLWGPGEQPSPSPALPQAVYQQPVQQPVQQVFQQPQPVYQQPVQQVFQQPQPQTVFQPLPVQKPTQEILDLMKNQGMPAPAGYPNYLLSDQL